MTPLERIAQALERAAPNVKGAELVQEVADALELARGLVAAERSKVAA